LSTYKKGIGLAFAGVVLLSFDSLMIRLSGVGGIEAAFWRGFFGFFSMLILFLGTEKKKSLLVLVSGGKPLIISGFFWGISGIFLTLGVQGPGVGQTLVMLSLSPLFGSLYAFLVYKEKPGIATILAAIGSILGITYMFHREFGNVDIGGLLITLGTPLCMGINLAYLRKHDGVNRVGVSMAGSFFGAIIALILGMGKVAVPLSALLPLLAVGIIIVPFAQVLISMGARYISGAESALITSLETVFGILYVWIFLGEIPHKDILTGGAFVLLCITANTLYHAHKEGAR